MSADDAIVIGAIRRANTAPGALAAGGPRTALVERELVGGSAPTGLAFRRRDFTDPQAAGAMEADFRATVALSDLPKTATHTEPMRSPNGFFTVLSDGERPTGAYALGPEAGEWLQQATLAIRASVPLHVLVDTIQPFPTFSEIYLTALKALQAKLAVPAAAEAGSP